MLHGFMGFTSSEMSRDDFMETYGPTRSNSMSSEKSECWDDDNSNSISSCTTIQESQTESDTCTTNYDKTSENINCTNLQNYRINKAASMDNVSNNELPASGAQHRNFRLQNLASKLTRKSFRLGFRKKTVSAGSTPTGVAPDTPSKWNAFRRNSSHVSCNSVQSEAASCSTPNDKRGANLLKVTHSSPTSISRSMRPSVLRSMSHSSTPPARKKLGSSAIRRNSTIKLKRNSAPSGRPGVLPSPTEWNSQSFEENKQIFAITHFSPAEMPVEYHLQRKYEQIRENEELKSVAIVTLLKRRKNSLKIKCDQFGKELDSNSLDGDCKKRIVERLKQMRKKLNIVEQFIDEQKESLKVSNAKHDLQLNLELYQLELLRENRHLRHSVSSQTSKSDYYMRMTPLMSSESCDTLESVDEASVFDDTSSVLSLEHKDSCEKSCVFPCKCDSNVMDSRSASVLSPASPTNNNELESPTDDNGTKLGRSRSVDFTVTSDCDSGFGNGDALSQSDVSLNRSLSKSSGSMTSASSRVGGSTVTTPSDGNKFFYAPSDSTSDPHLYKDAERTKLKSCRLEGSDVDRNTLALIEDFERFAERTLHRLAKKGTLIPLKKGS